jgi:hypothetical protein
LLDEWDQLPLCHFEDAPQFGDRFRMFVDSEADVWPRGIFGDVNTGRLASALISACCLTGF